MNQSLVNELRAECNHNAVEIAKIVKIREERNDPTAMAWEYAIHRQAKASCLQGIAALVAADKRK